MIELKTARDPRDLAELIASTLPNHLAPDPQSANARVGKLVRQAQAQAEAQRQRWDEMDTVNFITLDADNDWSDV